MSVLPSYRNQSIEINWLYVAFLIEMLKMSRTDNILNIVIIFTNHVYGK